MTAPTPTARLMLEDGTLFEGDSLGVPGTTYGELVFNTAATGYQEILTDPSYSGQIVMMTYPEIGNYGINPQDFESARSFVSGFVVRRISEIPSSWRATGSLVDFLNTQGVTGISNLDTRALTRHIRAKGAMRAGITTDPSLSNDSFLKAIQGSPTLDQQDLVYQVSTQTPYTLTGTTAEPKIDRLVVLDYGVKQNILNCFQEFVGELVVLPAKSDFETVMSARPSGVFLSNGPGDPSVLHGPIALAKGLMEAKIPTCGICLGHQILALASGARVEKMPFGHHGANHPVKDLRTGQITITSQNHGYAVEPKSVDPKVLEVTHINLNDSTIEGIAHRLAPMFSVQFHPEANPGPHDAFYLFEQFTHELRNATRSPL